MTAIKLGDVVRDSVSGFEGVVVARTEWLYGCVRYGVEARELHEGKLIEAQWFDEARLVPAIQTSAHGLAPVQERIEAVAAPGGPSRERRCIEG